MSLRITHALLACAAAFTLVSAEASAQSATGMFERTIDVAVGVTLDVVAGSGSIDIRRGPPGEVSVTGRISVGRQALRSAAEAEEIVRRLESEPPISVSGSQIIIGRIDDPDLQRSVSISYEIVAPEDTSVSARSGSGRQSLAGLAGRIESAAGSGSIRADDLAGDIDLRTGSGSIEAAAIGGTFSARTGSGSVRLDGGGSGNVDVTTGSGSITLRGLDGALAARAGSGNIEADGVQTGAWELNTGSGSIRVRLPADAAFEVDARTGSGSIRIDHEVAVTGRSTRNHLSGRVADGSTPLRLRTGSGSIRIERR
jgi:hypothetical protein